MRSLFLLVVVAMFFGGCGVKNDPGLVPEDTVGVDTIPGVDTVQTGKTVWADVKDLLVGRCGPCHSSYKTYAGCKKQGKKGLNSVISNYMPSGKKFTAAEKALYKAWIDDGMLP